MKSVSVILAVTLLLVGSRRAAAQDGAAAPPGSRAAAGSQADPNRRLARGDVSGVVGWFTVNKTEFDSGNDWLGRSVFGGAGIGWYWTDHLKTDVQFGASSEVRLYTATPVQIGNTRVFAPSTYTFSTRRATIGQLYQFGRNEWFHPFAGGGVDVVWERQHRTDEIVYYFDPVTRQSLLLRDRATRRATTEVDPLAFVATGFKGYMTRRAFFLLDGRLTFAKRPEEVLVRIGFGADF